MTDTKSICPECQKKIDAQLKQANGKIQITKQCPEHGNFEATHWQSTDVYNHMQTYDQFQYLGDLNAPKDPQGCPYVCETCTQSRFRHGHRSHRRNQTVQLKMCRLLLNFSRARNRLRTNQRTSDKNA